MSNTQVTKYFTAVTKKELKLEYKKLAFKYHPDRGGSTKIMQQINTEYHERLKNLSSNRSVKNKKTRKMDCQYDHVVYWKPSKIESRIRIIRHYIRVEFCLDDTELKFFFKTEPKSWYRLKQKVYLRFQCYNYTVLRMILEYFINFRII